MMKRLLALLLAIALLAALLTACGMTPSEPAAELEREETRRTETPVQERSEETEPIPEPEEEEEPIPEPEPTQEPEEEPEPENEPKPSKLTVYFLDVGQGDSAVIVCDGKAMLIDGGEASESDKLYSFLSRHGLDRLDCVVATHPDGDHVGGLSGALHFAQTERAYCTVKTDDRREFLNFLNCLNGQGVSVTVPEPGDHFSLGGAEVTFLYPGAGESCGSNTSLVLRVVHGDNSFLFTGDSEDADETALLLSCESLKSTVLKIAHHGSDSSTTESFLKAVAPQYAVLSVGGSNDYGHPTESVLQRLKDGNVQVFRTDMHGQITAVSDGTSLSFEAERNKEIDPFLAAGGYANMLAAEELARIAAEEAARTEEEQTEPSAEGTAQHYVVNTNTHKFHYPTCSSADEIKDKNRWDFTGTREELIEMGYVPCKRCKP